VGRQISSFKGRFGYSGISSVAFSPDGKLVLLCNSDIMELLEVNSGRVIRSFKGHSGAVKSVAFSPDGKLALSGSYDGTMKLWEVNSGQEIHSFKVRYSGVNSVAFSPDGKLALSGSDDKTMKLWEVNSGREIRSFKGHSGAVKSVAFSPDGKLALSGSYDGTMKLWEVNSGQEIHSFKVRYSGVNSVAFSPDGKLALSGSDDKTMKLWEVNSGREIRSFKGHSGAVKSVAFSPDGKLALSGSYDGSSRLWNVQTGEEIVQMIDFYDGEWASITPDGYYVASANGEKYLKNPSSQFNQPEKVRLALQPFTTQFAQSSPNNILIAKLIEKIVPSNIPQQQLITDTTPPQIIIHNKTRGPEETLVIDTIAHTISGQAIDESGIATITINNKSIRFNQKGHFSTQIQLQIGNNPIHITAIDTHNNTASKNITISRAEPSNLFAGNYHALVIGINDYPNFPKKDNLDMAVNDAQTVAQLLKTQYGFTVDLLLNEQATYKGIMRAFNNLNKKLEPNDNLLIYYSGHGIRDKYAGITYWLPTNAETNDETFWIIATRITSHIKRNPARHVLIVSDSCYSGTLDLEDKFRTLENIDLRAKYRQNYLQKMSKKPSRYLMSSGGNEPVLDNGGQKLDCPSLDNAKQRHSIFAKMFIEGLCQMEKNTFTAQELFFEGRIKERVGGRVKQIPELKPIGNSGHDGGNFIFKRQ